MNGQLKAKSEMEDCSHFTSGLKRRHIRRQQVAVSIKRYLSTTKSSGNHFANSTTHQRWLSVKVRQDGRPWRRSTNFYYVRYRLTLSTTINDGQTKWPTTVHYHFTTAIHPIQLSTLHCHTLLRSVLFNS